MSRQFVFSVHDLQEGGREFESLLTQAWMSDALADTEFGPCADAPGTLNVRLSMSGRDVVVRGRLRVPVEVPCARCLQPTRFEVATDISLLLMPGRSSTPSMRRVVKRGATPISAREAKPVTSRPRRHSGGPGSGRGRSARDDGKEGYEFTKEEADIDTYDGDEVILDGIIREIILLEAPNFPLCSEQCAGIRPALDEQRDSETTSEDIDPRLRPLLDIQTKRR